MKPRVVWAAQSPTLLNIFAQSSAWDLQVLVMQDAMQLAEMGQFSAPIWDGTKAGVEMVFACAPDHVAELKRTFPNAKMVLVAHQGYAQKLPELTRDARILTIGYHTGSLISEYSCRHNMRWKIASVVPFYKADPVWRWRPCTPWSMMSRPSTREPISYAYPSTVKSLSRFKLPIYGQDTDDGFLDQDGKSRLQRNCSAYVTVLHHRAGFGLAEHECMAMGCPIVGAMWGDTKNARNPEMTQAFTSVDDLYGIAEIVDRVCQDRDFAEQISKAECEWVGSMYSRQRMDESIQSAILCLW